MQYLTQGQFQRMHSAILTLPYLQACVVSGTISEDMCSCPSTDIIFSENYTLTQNLEINGNIIVKSGATLTIDGATVLFGQEKALNIENGGKVILRNNTTLNKCPQASFWNGILVNTGAELDAKESYIYNAKIGLRGNQNSTLTLDIVNIIGLNNTFGQGIYIEKGVNALKLNRLKIEDYMRGIDVWKVLLLMK